MLRYEEFCVRAHLEGNVLETWIAAGWILPAEGAPEPGFTEADLARARLIRDLRDDLGVNDEGIAVVLDLLDQIHGLRRGLRELATALGGLPKEARARIQQELKGTK
ncbi:MAG: chaperone modulator CbpM [Acetobacteraceae bacterium]